MTPRMDQVNSCGQILWTPCGLRNFARMGRPGGYGAIAGGADGPPLPKQPRRHCAPVAMTQSLRRHRHSAGADERETQAS